VVPLREEKRTSGSRPPADSGLAPHRLFEGRYKAARCAALVAALGLSCELAGCGPLLMPSDARLESNFHRRKSEFETLVRMAREDTQLHAVSAVRTLHVDDAGHPLNGVGTSPERWNEYRRLFKEVGVPAFNRNSDYPGAIFLPADASGIVSAEVIKGYVYSQEPLSPLVKTLDHGIPPELSTWRRATIAFKKVDQNWYLYYDDD
jgi:hypothetical protein